MCAKASSDSVISVGVSVIYACLYMPETPVTSFSPSYSVDTTLANYSLFFVTPMTTPLSSIRIIVDVLIN